ncbi:hypothetical protein [Flavobacterium psychrotrophum]|uniref:hypothetical protein n=1 Tax=Flavobacterium psychrotrophum TaxID=2294119 RepID=UPI0013C41D4D|nr:hypothetical protein [Flavobacterium psychrotrophum]
MKKFIYTIAGLLAFGLASAQTDTVSTSISRPMPGNTMSPTTSSPAPNPVNSAPQQTGLPNNVKPTPQDVKPPTQPPNTNGIPVTPGSPAVGPVTTPTTKPTQSAINPGVPQRP